MNQVKKTTLLSAFIGSIASTAFGGFINFAGTDFTTLTGSTDIYWADLGVYNVPNGFKVDVLPSAGATVVDVGTAAVEGTKIFPGLSGGKYHVFAFLADPIEPQNIGNYYTGSFDFSSYGVVSAVSYWDGRYGGYSTIDAAAALVGAPYVFESYDGAGFESHENDVIPGSQPQDAFTIAANKKSIEFDLWAYEINPTSDRFVDMAFVFVAPVPEPSSIVFALTGGVLGLLLYRNAGRRRQS